MTFSLWSSNDLLGHAELASTGLPASQRRLLRVATRGDTSASVVRMTSDPLRITYIGGPTALLELAGSRLLTDPTFDPTDTEYPTPAYTLRKTQSPALTLAELGHIDAILLSHDHHFDNLDHAGRAAAWRF